MFLDSESKEDYFSSSPDSLEDPTFFGNDDETSLSSLSDRMEVTSNQSKTNSWEIWKQTL